MRVYIFIIILFTWMLPVQSFASQPSENGFAEAELLIEKMAWDTGCVSSFSWSILPEEPYVEDIPFNTGIVVNEQGTQLPEEAYVDDIPFDTEYVVQSFKPGILRKSTPSVKEMGLPLLDNNKM